jgi:DNA-binding NarL/FixJ family response regulator
VECHTKNIYRKLAVNSRTETVFQGRRHGLLR